MKKNARRGCGVVAGVRTFVGAGDARGGCVLKAPYYSEADKLRDSLRLGWRRTWRPSEHRQSSGKPGLLAQALLTSDVLLVANR